MRPPDFFIEFAKEVHHVPDDWRWTKLDAHDDDGKRFPPGSIRIDGAVYPDVCKSGPRKGRTNFNKPTPGTERTIWTSETELDAFKAEWERRTGMCRRCGDTGEEVDTIHFKDNLPTTYRPCDLCKKRRLVEA